MAHATVTSTLTSSALIPDGLIMAFSNTVAHRDTLRALYKGWRLRCPACGQGHLFGKYLKVEPACSICGQELYHQRSDDAPPYFTMLVVGHVIVGLVLAVETRWHPPLWVHGLVWIPLTLAMSLWLLPRIKGALIGMQWAQRMHGFGTAPDPAQPEHWPSIADQPHA